MSGAPPAYAPRRDRIQPADLYRYMDYMRERWDELDVYCNAKRVVKLRGLVDRIPDPYYDRCQPHLTTLARGIDLPAARSMAAFMAIRSTVSEWGRSRRAA